VLSPAVDDVTTSLVAMVTRVVSAVSEVIWLSLIVDPSVISCSTVVNPDDVCSDVVVFCRVLVASVAFVVIISAVVVSGFVVFVVVVVVVSSAVVAMCDVVAASPVVTLCIRELDTSDVIS